MQFQYDQIDLYLVRGYGTIIKVKFYIVDKVQICDVCVFLIMPYLLSIFNFIV